MCSDDMDEDARTGGLIHNYILRTYQGKAESLGSKILSVGPEKGGVGHSPTSKDIASNGGCG